MTCTLRRRSGLLCAALSLALTAVTSLASAAPATPEALLAALDKASRSGDAAALDALITDDYRYALPDPGERLVRKLARRTPAVRPVGSRIEGRRGALTVDLGQQALVLLALQGTDGWRIDGVALTPEGAATFLAGSPVRPPRDERLMLVAAALADAVARGDTKAAGAWMTPAFLAADRDGGGDLIAQCVRKGLTLLPREARVVGAIGAATLDVEREGRLVDRLWLLARRQPDGQWRFEAVTEDTDRVAATLAGRIEPRMDPRRLPSEPGAEALVEALRGALRAKDGEAAVALLGPPAERTPGIGQPRARRWLKEAAARGGVISPAAVHVDREQGRGAARFTISTPSDDKGGGDQTVWLYLDRTDGRWAVVDLNFGLTERWFYAGPSPIPRLPRAGGKPGR